MAHCTRCGGYVECPGHTHRETGQTSVGCTLNKGVLWAHVVDEAGNGVKGCLVSGAGQNDLPTDDLGLASFGTQAANPYQITLSTVMPDSHQQTHKAPQDRVATAVVADGEIARATFQLVRRKPIIRVRGLDCGRAPVGERSNALTITVHNDGDATLTLSKITFDAEFPEAGTNAVKANHGIPEGQSAEILIQFAPTKRFGRAGGLVIESNDPERKSVSAGLTGTGLEPVLEVVDTHNWPGAVIVGQSLLQAITVRNSGDADLVVSGIAYPALFGEDPTNAFKPNDSLHPNATKDIVVLFQPTAGGPQTGNLVLTSNDPANAGKKTVVLNATAIAPWKLSVCVTSTQRGADWPVGDIEAGVSTAANSHNSPERIWNATRTLAAQDNGTFTVPDAQTGTVTTTLYVWARAANGLWASTADVPVTLNPGDTPTVTVNMVPRLLQLFLDVDRDGAIDNAPANNTDWTWGQAGRGAILTVKSRTYVGAAPVQERSPLELAWLGNLPADAWQATLSVDHADRIRIFRGQAANADHLLGDNIAGPFDLHADPAISDALGHNQRVRLWMEAIDYPETAPEADWKVLLTLTCGGKAQSAMLRIAPWIMGSDLDRSDHVYVRVTTGQVNTPEYALAQEVSNFTNGICTLFPVGGEVSKGFARDIMKTGYTAGPHYSGIVIQSQLDRSPIYALPRTAAANSQGATIIKPRGTQENDLGGGDNGGNLLVSPPSDDFPWGRILFGASAQKANRSEAFYTAQAIQRPIRLDSTWLRVGHVDEMLSIVRGGDGAYRALLMSPRLGYIMLRAVASSTVFADAGQLIDWAVAANDRCIQGGIYTEPGMDGELATLLANVPEANPAIAFAGVPNYVAAPPTPANLDRFVVARVVDREIAEFMAAPQRLIGRNNPIANQFNTAFPRGSLCYEIRVHATRFLAKADLVLRQVLSTSQIPLDNTRVILRNQLGFTNDRIIEVPVILNREGDDIVALTGDSVNLLQLAGAPGSRCMVPKPFGPIFAGEYVYERYLAAKLGPHGANLTAVIAADDKFHVMEGEIHCGTNQTHPVLAGARQRWWEWVAP